MRYQWQFQPYRRRFKQALQTSHGLWALREGIILRLVDDAGKVGWGEIAPIPWFGSETLEQALAFCHQLPAILVDDRIFSIPDALPSCQFAFESAWEGIREQAIDKTEPQRRRDAENEASLATENSTFQAQNSTLRPQNSDVAVSNSDVAVQNSTLRPQNSDVAALNSDVAAQSSDVAVQNSTPRPLLRRRKLQNSIVEAQSSERQAQNLFPLPSSLSSALLPAGNAALHAWKPLWEQGFRTFKWKIGVSAIATELEIFHSLTHNLPGTAKLRLDANGGLSTDEATQWLQACDAITANPKLSIDIEYIEQPLNVSQFQAMQDLSQRHKTPIALDESVATLQQLQTCYENGWQGIFVIKPAIVGSPSRLRQFCQEHPIDAVFSSAFETAIGRHVGLQLAAALGNPDRSLGYGTAHWFKDDEPSDFEELWQTL